MDQWIGPAIIAALVSAIVSVLGWIVTSRQAVSLERRRRTEKVHDFQVALRAEIASDRLALIVVDHQAFLAEIRSRYAADPAFSVVVPHSASNTIFLSIVQEIHVLPAAVIGPVVDYSRLRETIERFIEDMRSERFRMLTSERQLAMYADYLDMLARLEILADNALVALNGSLNIRGEDPPSRLSASAPAGVSKGPDEAPKQNGGET